MNQLVYRSLRPFLGIIWRFFRILSLFKMVQKYSCRYTVKIYSPGNGIHFKWILTSKITGHMYLVKTTHCYIEWWHRAVSEYKKIHGHIIDYDSLDFKRIYKDILHLTSHEELRSLTLFKKIDFTHKEIWYKYLPDAVPLDINNKNHLSMFKNIKQRLEYYNFKHGDEHPDNYLVHSNQIYMIDLESITWLKGSC